MAAKAGLGRTDWREARRLPNAGQAALGANRRSAGSLDRWAFSLLLVALCVMGGAGLRSLGAPLVVVILLISLAYARSTIFTAGHAPLLIFTAWGLLYVALSHLHILPQAWTRHHETALIAQQASFVFLLLPMVAASQKWWDDPAAGSHRIAVLKVVVFSVFFLSTPISMVVHGDLESLLGGLKPFITLQYDVLIGLLAITYIAFLRTPPVLGTGLLLLVLLLSIGMEFRLQNVQAYFVAFSVLLALALSLRLDRVIISSFILLTCAVGLYGMFDPLTLFNLDPNTGWRAVFWRDAFEAVGQTWGLGVGFGTEALRNEYSTVVGRAFFLPEEDLSFILIGTHNGFVDTALRLGVIGFALLCMVIGRCYPKKNLPPMARAHAAVVFCAVFICIYSNVAMQSPLYLLGIAFCIGYLQSLRRKAEHALPVAGVPLVRSVP